VSLQQYIHRASTIDSEVAPQLLPEPAGMRRLRRLKLAASR
jgi:hypothetical protein